MRGHTVDSLKELPVTVTEVPTSLLSTVHLYINGRNTVAANTAHDTYVSRKFSLFIDITVPSSNCSSRLFDLRREIVIYVFQKIR